MPCPAPSRAHPVARRRPRPRLVPTTLSSAPRNNSTREYLASLSPKAAPSPVSSFGFSAAVAEAEAQARTSSQAPSDASSDLTAEATFQATGEATVEATADASAEAASKPEAPRPSTSARSFIGRRALRDIAVVRGRAERALASLRIRVQTAVATVLSVSAGDGWRPLGVFGWQVVRGADAMPDADVDEVRSLQRFGARTREGGFWGRVRKLLRVFRVGGGKDGIKSGHAQYIAPPRLQKRIGKRVRRLPAAGRELTDFDLGRSMFLSRKPVHPVGRHLTDASLYGFTRDAAALASPVVKADVPSASAKSSVKPGPVLSGFNMTRFGTGALALGVGAVLGSGGLAAALTASAAVLAASAMVTSSEKKGAGDAVAPGSFLPGVRRSKAVRRIDRSIINAAAPPALRTQPIVPTPPVGIVEVKSDEPANVVLEVLPQAPVAAQRPAKSRMPRLKVRRTGAGLLSAAFAEDVETIGVVAGAALDIEEQNEVDIEADSYEVLSSTPAVFSIPFLGAVLNFLDGVAYAVEQTAGRVLRRASVAGVPGLVFLMRRKASSDWEVHRSLQHRTEDL